MFDLPPNVAEPRHHLPKGVDDIFANPLKALKVSLRGPRTEGPMAAEIDLSKARPAEDVHEKHVLEAMSDVELTKRDLRWFAEKGVPVPDERKPGKDTQVPAE